MAPYRPFDLRVLRTARLSPSFIRVTLGGPDLAAFSAHGYDQRMNLAFGPAAATLLTAPDWMTAWRGDGISLRSYTIRAFRPDALEVDVDFVRHDHGGPAGQWARSCRPGHRMVMIGATHGHPVSDVAWSPPPAARRGAAAAELLIAADETAVPAAAAILASLPSSAAPTVVLEVPTAGDVLEMATPAAARVTWLARSRGERLEPVVRDLLAGPAPTAAGSVPDADPGEEIWDVPAPAGGGFYAWLAGESGTVTALRRHLVTHRGADREAVAFMGYWKRRRPVASAAAETGVA